MKKYLQSTKSHICHQAGMTLVELMVSMIILGLITSAGLPAMKDFFDRKNIDAIAPFFERTIKLARVEASHRNVDVRVRPSSGNDDWSQGWFIEYTDPTDSTVKIIIKRFDAIQSGITFSSPTFDDTTAGQLTISPTGQSTGGAFELYVAPCVAGDGYELNLLLSGTIKQGLITCTL